MKQAHGSIILVRHGSTEAAAGMCIGQLDTPLSAVGRSAVVAARKRWSGEFPKRLFCSDLQRAGDTAALLIGNKDIEPLADPRLREINLGAWQGRQWDDIHRSEPEQLARWGEDWLTCAPPDGETAMQLYNRVAEWYDELQQADNLPTLIVAHTGSLAALACRLHRRSPQHLFDYSFEHCAPLQLHQPDAGERH